MFEMTLQLPLRVKRIHPRPIKSGSNFAASDMNVNAFSAQQTGIAQLLPEDIQEREEKAYQFGVEDGKKLALEEVQEKLTSSILSLEEGIRAFQHSANTMFRENEPVVFELAIGIASRILKKEIQQDPQMIRNIAADAIRLVEDKHRLLIRANPENVQVLQEYASESLAGLQGIDKVEILEDSRIEPGGCVVESQSGIVDAQIKTQLAEIYDNLMDSVAGQKVA